MVIFMKKFISILLISVFCFSTSFAEEVDEYYKPRAVASDSYNQAALSMAIWGVGLALGIAALFVCIRASRE